MFLTHYRNYCCLLAFLFIASSLLWLSDTTVFATNAYYSPWALQTINVPGDAATIQAAIDMANDGDTVLLSPGIYHENIVIENKAVILASRYHTTGDSSYIENTIIDGIVDGVKGTVIYIHQNAGDGTQIIGLTIQNGKDGLAGGATYDLLYNRVIKNADGVDYQAGGGICRGNLFEDNTDDGIDLDGPTAVIIEDNIVRNNGDDGIEIRLHPYNGDTLEIVMRNNLISGNGEDGIQLIDKFDVDKDTISDRVITMERNVIYNNAMAGIGMMSDQNSVEDYEGASIEEPIYLFNNTISGHNHGLTGGDNLVAVNNIIVNSTNIGVKNSDANSILAYNLFWNNGTDISNSNQDSATTFFTDPELDTNYHLLAGSFAIDRGTASFTWNSKMVLDLSGSDYAGTAPDLGAYETDASGPSNTPTVTRTPTITNTPSATSTATPTPTQTSTPTSTSTNTPTQTASPIWTVTSTSTSTPTEAEANTVTPTHTTTSTSISAPTNSATPTDSSSPIYTSTATAIYTPTPTYTATSTDMVTPTNTSSPTITNTVMPIDTPTITPTPTLTSTSTPICSLFEQNFTVRVADIHDDVEELYDNGSINTQSIELELDNERIVGLRFQNVELPPGIEITNAFIEFVANHVNLESTSAVLYAEAVDNAAPFLAVNYNVSNRHVTSNNIHWTNLPAWNSVAQTYRSLDLAPIVRELIARPGWQSGNAVVFIITTEGRRAAKVYDEEPQSAPLLSVNYINPCSDSPLSTTTPTPTTTSISSLTPTQTSTLTPTSTPIATATPTTEPSTTPTATPIATATPTPSVTPTAVSVGTTSHKHIYLPTIRR